MWLRRPDDEDCKYAAVGDLLCIRTVDREEKCDEPQKRFASPFLLPLADPRNGEPVDY